MDVIQVLDKYGWPAFFLIIIGTFFWKKVWPLLEKRAEQVEQRAVENGEFLKEQINETRQRNEKITSDFLLALEKRDAIDRELIGEITRGFDRIVTRVDLVGKIVTDQKNPVE